MLCRIFFWCTILIQILSSALVVIHSIRQILSKNEHDKMNELKMRKSVFWFGYIMIIVLGIAAFICSDDFCMLCLFSSSVILAFFIMVFQVRWKIQYGGNEVYVQNFWGKRKNYLKDELTEKYNGRIVSIFYQGKCIAEYDILLVKVNDSVSLSRFIYERERIRNQTKCTHRKKKK